MDVKTLDKKVRSITPSEQWHLDNPGKLSPVYNDIPKIAINNQEVFLFDWRNTVKRNSIGLIKESRFTTVPPHVNSNMEIDYVYDGACMKSTVSV